MVLPNASYNWILYTYPPFFLIEQSDIQFPRMINFNCVTKQVDKKGKIKYFKLNLGIKEQKSKETKL